MPDPVPRRPRSRIPRSLRDAARDLLVAAAIAAIVMLTVWLVAAHAQDIPGTDRKCPGKPIPVVAVRAEMWTHWYEGWEYMPPGWTRPNGQHAIPAPQRTVIPETGPPAIWVDEQGVVRCFRRPPDRKK